MVRNSAFTGSAASGTLDVQRDDGPVMRLARRPTADECRESERFQLRPNRVHAELPGDRDEDIKDIPGLPQLLCLRQELQRPHIVQPVRHPHDHDPGVGGAHRRHRLRHFAPLVSADVAKRHVPGHHRRDFRAELAPQLGKRARGVLDRVMQYRRAQRLVVGAKPGQDRRDRRRMGDYRSPLRRVWSLWKCAATS